MIRINLLPFRAARTKENVRRQVSVFILLIMLIGVGMIATWLYLGKTARAEKAKLAAIKIELDKYTAKAREVDRINKENALLQKKIDIINDLETVRKEPVQMFQALNETIVAERMWLTEFKVNGSSIVLKGIALDEITVADFTKRLQNAPVYSNVVIKILKQSVKNNIKMKNFEISATISKVPNTKTDISKALK